MAVKLILYGTSACHLCDEALATVQPIATAFEMPLHQVDIAGDESLEARYGVRIPILVFNRQELGWPFDTTMVIAFLRPQKD
jgi:hypothetical protein